MMKPTIHSNGTSAQSLLDLYLTAGMAIRDAIRALEQSAPNARDYYTQELDSFAKAVAEHMSRIEKLIDARVEINILADFCSDFC